MIRTERVALGSIVPDPNNPRREFSGLDELAAQFAYTPDRPGEPFMPLLVVELPAGVAGPRYRIVDGERRWHAMVEAGEVETCLVNVADTMEDASSLAAMLATDDKQPLTPEERSRGVQQMLQIGIDDEQIETLGRLRKGSARTLRRVVEEAGGVVQTSLDSLFKVAEVEDPQKRAQLLEELGSPGTAEGGKSFTVMLREAMTAQENAKDAAAFREWCEGCGFEVVDRPPAGCVKHIRLSQLPPDPEEAGAVLREAGITCAVISVPGEDAAYYECVQVTLWRPLMDDESEDDAAARAAAEDAESEESDAKLDAFMARMAEAAERHRTYMFAFVECMEPLVSYKSCARMRDLLWASLMAVFGDLEGECERAGRKLPREYPAFLIPMIWDDIDSFATAFDLGAAVVNADAGACAETDIEEYLTLLQALEESGYTLTDFERSTRETLRELMAATGVAEEDR